MEVLKLGFIENEKGVFNFKSFIYVLKVKFR